MLAFTHNNLINLFYTACQHPSNSFIFNIHDSFERKTHHNPKLDMQEGSSTTYRGTLESNPSYNKA